MAGIPKGWIWLVYLRGGYGWYTSGVGMAGNPGYYSKDFWNPFQSNDCHFAFNKSFIMLGENEQHLLVCVSMAQ